VRALLDTHTFIWFAEGSASLSAVAAEFIGDGENDLLLSVASLWEMAIKVNLGRLRFDAPFDEWITEHLQRLAIDVAQITVPHLAVIATLPLHHRDPFDRMIAAQGIADGLPIVSVDKAFDSYPVSRIW
jgi:PIN domain nuclease of toxin-antitoxin system